MKHYMKNIVVHFRFIFKCSLYVDYFKHTCQIFEDDVSDEKMLYQIVFLFFYLKPLSARFHYH